MLDDTTWTTGEEAIENLAMEPCYVGLDQILGARLIRKEGDTGRITAVRAALRAEAKLLTRPSRDKWNPSQQFYVDEDEQDTDARY